jgi:hypothetical protein
MCTIISRRLTLGLALLLSFFATVSAGAFRADQRALPIVVNGDNNETAKAEMDLLAGRAEGKLIILIARLGNGESSNRLAQQRLRTISDYLKNTRAVPEERLVTAVGQRRRGAGRIEAYLDGELFMVFELRRNRDFAPEP